MFKWGIIGTGGIARAFADDITNLENHKVCAVLSRNIETADKFSLSINDCLGYDDQHAFLNDDNLDAVYVATPNTLHCDQTISALKSNKPTLCEKPFSMNADEAHLMIQASKKFSTTLLDGMWMRYLPHILRLKEILNEGHIGDIQSIYACHGQNLQWSKNPRLWRASAGGDVERAYYSIEFDSHEAYGKFTDNMMAGEWWSGTVQWMDENQDDIINCGTVIYYNAI